MSGPTIPPAEAGGVSVEALAAAMKFLSASGAPAPAPAPAPAAAWGAQPASWAPPAVATAPGGLPQPVGVLIPITLGLPNGSEVSVYLQFGPEVAAPQALQAVIALAVQSGVPIKTWQPRAQNGGGYGGGGNRYGGNGGGYGGRRY